jgi:hypothetical protein
MEAMRTSDRSGSNATPSPTSASPYPSAKVVAPALTTDTTTPGGSGAGLVGLAERLRLVGGTIYSGPTPAGGWELRAIIPRPAAEETL